MKTKSMLWLLRLYVWTVPVLSWLTLGDLPDFHDRPIYWSNYWPVWSLAALLAVTLEVCERRCRAS